MVKKPYPKNRASRKLTAPVQLLILNLVMDNPGIYLHEIRDKLIDILSACQPYVIVVLQDAELAMFPL